jgi:polysaccharide pyruvyl transferase WcaK-like protein
VFAIPHGLIPVIIPFFPAEDRAICLRYRRHLPQAVMVEGLSPSEVLGIIGQASLVFGMRLHALIFADRMGIPWQEVGHSPKLTAYSSPTSPCGRPAEGDRRSPSAGRL